MKKFLFLFLLFLPLIGSGKSMEWEEVQCIVLPLDTPIYSQVNNTGNVKYYIKVYTQNGDIFSISVSRTNVEMFRGGIIKLELVKWRSRSTGKYKYTVRKHNPTEADINLETITTRR